MKTAICRSKFNKRVLTALCTCKRINYHERPKVPLKRVFVLKFNNFTNMQIKLTKSNVARITQSLIAYKSAHPETQTPMRDMYMTNVQTGMQLDEPEYREQHLRVARYLGWPVTKRGGRVYENGLEIWSTDGR